MWEEEGRYFDKGMVIKTMSQLVEIPSMDSFIISQQSFKRPEWLYLGPIFAKLFSTALNSQQYSK